MKHDVPFPNFLCNLSCDGKRINKTAAVSSLMPVFVLNCECE